MSQLAFMPWVQVESSIVLHGCRLVPYDVEAAGPEASEVLGCYFTDAVARVPRATLIQIDGNLVSNLTPEARTRVFRVGSWLAFVGLLRRPHFVANDYVNADSFQVVIEPVGTNVSVITQRRSGRSMLGTQRDNYRVQCPDHVDDGVVVRPDEDVLRALEAAHSNEMHAALVSEVLLQFLLADSDNPRIDDTMQLFLFSGAIQRLLEQHNTGNEHDLAAGFEELCDEVKAWRPASAATCSRTGVAGRFAKITLRQGWYRDFYQARGTYAHGTVTTRAKRLWSVDEHLLMASFVVPRLLLVLLSTWGYYCLSERDRQELRAIDRVLALPDLYASRGKRGAERWAWREAFRVACTETHDDGSEEDIMFSQHAFVPDP